jgi:hypothetical protein
MIPKAQKGGRWLELRRGEREMSFGGIGRWVVRPRLYPELMGYGCCTGAVADLCSSFQRRGKGVQRQGSQQVAAHAALDFSQALGGAVDPGKIGGLG